MNLYFLNGKRKGEQWELVPPGICIGREVDNDIQILAGGISRYHAKLEYVEGDKWKIQDLGSTNGTRLNGKKIDRPAILKAGDEIQIGEQVLRVDLDYASNPEKPEETSEKQDIPLKTEPKKTASAEPQAPSNEKPVGQSNETEKIDLDIFWKGDKKDKSDREKEPANPKKRIVNLLFSLLVTVLACVAVLVFVMLWGAPNDNRPVRAVQTVQNPFFLDCEKIIYTRDNVFRFSIRIENDSAQFKLNDLKYQRRFSKGIARVDKDLLKTLVNEIKDTDFMKISSDPEGSPANGVDEIRTLTIGYDTSLNQATVRNSYPKRSFEAIENALNQFADDYGLKTISLSQKEMREEAIRSFRKAEELLANYQAKPENLRNAILRYQIAIDFLDQFDPKPEEWAVAKRKLSEADTLMKKAIKDAQFNINVLYKKREYAAAISECGKLMQIIDPEHKSYQKIRDLKITLEKKLSSRKKKGKR